MNLLIFLLISRAGINKIGNMVYDYGNSVWFASMGEFGKIILGIYKTSELTISIIFNPIGGVISDRFSRKKVLVTTDLICFLSCLFSSLISNDTFMIWTIVVTNIVLAISFSFSRPANKSYIAELVDREQILKYNSILELVLQIITVCSPVFSFIIIHYTNLRTALFINAISFLLAAVIILKLPDKKEKISINKAKLSTKIVFEDIKEGFRYIKKTREVFFLLIVASIVNLFFAAFDYLLPFTDIIYNKSGSYAIILTLGAIGAITGALICSRIKNHSVKILFITLAMIGFSVIFMSISFLSPIPTYVSYAGNFSCELFMTIFNITFFSQIQSKVCDEFMGRVFSSIFTISILLAPFSTLFMAIIPSSIHFISFVIIGISVLIFSILSYLYWKNNIEGHL